MVSRRTGIRAKPLLAMAFLLGLILVTATVSVASAAVVSSDKGVKGPYVVPDEVTPETSYPGARCGYSGETDSGDAFLRWMKFRKPDVYARDVTGEPDRQKVTLIYRLQRSTGSGWRTVASSSQTKTAWDTDPADFRAKKLDYNGQAGELLRGVVHIKWLRGGSVEGAVKLALEYYSVKWTVGTDDYIFEGACTGAAD